MMNKRVNKKMPSKIRVLILAGGKSAEHEISLESAKNIAAALKQLRSPQYEIILFKIGKEGKEYLETLPAILGQVDVVFPALHGLWGEDGTIQGLLKLANKPFVGASVLGSAISMDKDVMKRLLNQAGIKTARFLVFRPEDEMDFEKIRRTLGLPLFIKPANLGSSVGIHKATNQKEFQKAVKDAFQYDPKIVIEEFLDGREIECAVLGNESPKASLPGEIIAKQGFYSYEAKYQDPKGAVLKIPAELPDKITTQIQKLAIQTFRTLECQGLARVDFFLLKNHEIRVNELNTLPGFTKISMYPKLWEKSGLPEPELIDQLIKLATLRFKKEQRQKTSFF